jgi:hypothetical protein
MSGKSSPNLPSWLSHDSATAYESVVRQALIVALWNGSNGMPVADDYASKSNGCRSMTAADEPKAFKIACTALIKCGWFGVWNEIARKGRPVRPQSSESVKPGSESELLFNKIEIDVLFHGFDRGKDMVFDDRLILLDVSDFPEPPANEPSKIESQPTDSSTGESSKQPLNPCIVTSAEDDSPSTDPLQIVEDNGESSEKPSDPFLVKQISDKAIKLANQSEGEEVPNCYVVFEVTVDANLFQHKLLQLERILTLLLVRKQLQNKAEYRITDIVRVAGLATTRDVVTEIKIWLSKNKHNLPNIWLLAESRRLFFLLQQNNSLSAAIEQIQEISINLHKRERSLMIWMAEWEKKREEEMAEWKEEQRKKDNELSNKMEKILSLLSK